MMRQGFALSAGRPIPGAERRANGWVRAWTGTGVMGVLNVTPDSFSDGGRFLDHGRAIAHGRAMAAAGALLLDVGGESTRPGAPAVDPATEIDRIRPVIAALADAGFLISVDTRHAEVALAAIAAGAHVVNDVGGLRVPEMVQVCATTGTPAIAMHMRGSPATMQHDPTYTDVVLEVTEFLEATATAALAAGVPSVMVDPGIGFGKTVDHNLALLRGLPLTTSWPVVVGASRKRFIEHIAGHAPPDRRDPGSLAVHLFAAQRGVAIVRAHDVAGHVQALAVDLALRRHPATE